LLFYQNQGSSFFESFFSLISSLYCSTIDCILPACFFLSMVILAADIAEKSLKVLQTQALLVCCLWVPHRSVRVASLPSCSSLLLHGSILFCSPSRLMVSSPKNSPFLTLSTLDKSISGLTDLKSPIFTRRSYLLLTAGILIFISRDMGRKDFLPSSIKNDFRIQRRCCVIKVYWQRAAIYSMPKRFNYFQKR
jgi:hypothetical protein